MSQKDPSPKIRNSEESFSHSTQVLNTFAPRLLAWFETSGRHDLPWQQHQTDNPNPYFAYSKRINNIQSLTFQFRKNILPSFIKNIYLGV